MASENPKPRSELPPSADVRPDGGSTPGAPKPPPSPAEVDDPVAGNKRDTAQEGPDSTAPGGPDSRRRRRFETMLPSLIRRGIEKGIEAGLNTFEKSVETGRETTGAVREVLHDVKVPRDVANAVGKALSEAKLPRDIASAVFGQIDDTKNDVLRIVAREVRDFLEATDLATELKKALTSLSFEVRTEVRFIPNEAGEGVKADVRSRTRVKRTPKPSRRDRGLRRGKIKSKPADTEAEHEEEDEDGP